jgi:hypothetical protein
MPLVIRQRTSTGWRDLAAPPPPLTSNMLIGATSSHPPLSPQQSWTQILQPQVGPLVARRSFHTEAQGIPSSWAASQAAMDIGLRTPILSIRPPIADFIAGTYDTAWRTFLRSIPDDGFPKFLVAWHEPDAKVRQGIYTRSQFMTAFQRFADLLHEEAIPNTYATMNMSNYLWIDPAQGAGHPEEWWQDGVYDIWSINAYDASPSAMFNAGSQFARDHDVPWAVGETGFVDDFNNTAIKATWISDVAAYCANRSAGGWPSAVFCCWFDSAEDRDESIAAGSYTPTSSPASIAAATAVCQTYYRDPRTLILP